MNKLRILIKQYCGLVGPQDSLPAQLKGRSDEFPKGYLDAMFISNGLVLKSGLFRMFGTKKLSKLPSVLDWNSSAWKRAYGPIFDNTFLAAEDIFGDQYGFVQNEYGQTKVVKVFCEGGGIEVQEETDFMNFLMGRVLVPRPLFFDYDLAQSAWVAGLRPELNEHLAFRLPLVCGGQYNISNLHIESSVLHLGLLGQMTVNNKSLTGGTPIARFKPLS